MSEVEVQLKWFTDIWSHGGKSMLLIVYVVSCAAAADNMAEYTNCSSWKWKMTNQAVYTMMKNILPYSVSHDIMRVCWQTNVCHGAMVRLIQPIKQFSNTRLILALVIFLWDSFLPFDLIQCIYSIVFTAGLFLSRFTLSLVDIHCCYSHMFGRVASKKSIVQLLYYSMILERIISHGIIVQVLAD